MVKVKFDPKKKKSEEEPILELTAIRDEGVEGISRIRFVFPSKPTGVAGALHPSITGAIWLDKKKNTTIPDKILITLKKE